MPSERQLIFILPFRGGKQPVVLRLPPVIGPAQSGPLPSYPGTSITPFPLAFNESSGHRVVRCTGWSRSVGIVFPKRAVATPALFSLTASATGAFSALIAGTSALLFAGPGIARSGSIFVGHGITSFSFRYQRPIGTVACFALHGADARENIQLVKPIAYSRSFLHDAYVSYNKEYKLACHTTAAHAIP
jgi:hypothetical protein